MVSIFQNNWISRYTERAISWWHHDSAVGIHLYLFTIFIQSWRTISSQRGFINLFWGQTDGYLTKKIIGIVVKPALFLGSLSGSPPIKSTHTSANAPQTESRSAPGWRRRYQPGASAWKSSAFWSRTQLTTSSGWWSIIFFQLRRPILPGVKPSSQIIFLNYNIVSDKTCYFFRVPVFLQHGMSGCSVDFLIDEESLGYALVSAGFDVWLGNVRGNRFSVTRSGH